LTAGILCKFRSRFRKFLRRLVENTFCFGQAHRCPHTYPRLYTSIQYLKVRKSAWSSGYIVARNVVWVGKGNGHRCSRGQSCLIRVGDSRSWREGRPLTLFAEADCGLSLLIAMPHIIFCMQHASRRPEVNDTDIRIVLAGKMSLLPSTRPLILARPTHFRLLAGDRADYIWCAIVLGAIVLSVRCQLDDVSVCCNVETGGIDGYLMRPRTVLLVSQATHAVSPDIHSVYSPSTSLGIPLGQADRLWNHLGLPCLRRVTVQPSLVKSPTARNVLDFNRSSLQPPWHSNATSFKCHQRSQIIQDTAEPTCLSEKLISKHAH